MPSRIGKAGKSAREATKGHSVSGREIQYPARSRSKSFSIMAVHGVADAGADRLNLGWNWVYSNRCNAS